MRICFEAQCTRLVLRVYQYVEEIRQWERNTYRWSLSLRCWRQFVIQFMA